LLIAEDCFCLFSIKGLDYYP